MAPDNLGDFFSNVDRGRRDFLRKIIAGAAFTPPLIASFSLEGPSITAAQANAANQCANQSTPQVIFTDFSGTEYQDKFQGILRPSDINPGTDLAGGGRPSLNFTGGANAAGSTWLTQLKENTLPGELCLVQMSADVLFHAYNNTKGAGLLAFRNQATGKGLVLIVFDAGNSDLLQLAVVDQVGKLTNLKTISLGAGIGENVWYRLILEVSNPDLDPITVTGKVFRHTVPTNPNSPLGTQVDGNLEFSGPLPIGLDPTGDIGLVARAVSAVADLSVTNFTATGFEAV